MFMRWLKSLYATWKWKKKNVLKIWFLPVNFAEFNGIKKINSHKWEMSNRIFWKLEWSLFLQWMMIIPLKEFCIENFFGNHLHTFCDGLRFLRANKSKNSIFFLIFYILAVSCNTIEFFWFKEGLITSEK